MDNIAVHEAQIRDYAAQELSKLNWLNIQGETATKGAIFSFTIDGIGHPHDVSTIIDQQGIAVRAGHHCAQPLMKHLGLTATARASFAMYNTTQEVDKLAKSLTFCHDILT